jgi:hypothetical protein
VLSGMDLLEWRDSGRIWIVGTAIIPMCALLGPWWLVVGRPADPTTGRVPRWIVWGEATVTLAGLAVGFATIGWWLWLK